MRRTRWVIVVVGLSLLLNAFLGVALWRTQGETVEAAPAPTAAPATWCCQEERAIREQLETQMCAEVPDRTAIEATFARLDAVRLKERKEALDQWMAGGRRTGCQNGKMSPNVGRLLCPWRYGPEEGCAPASGQPSRPDPPPR